METVKEKFLDASGFLINPVALYYLHKMYIKYEIAADVLITSEWTEILPKLPLKIQKRLQRISLQIRCEQNLDQEEDIWFLANGTVIHPQVQIVDEFGNTYELEGGQAGGHHKSLDIFVASSLGFSYKPGGLPKDRTYTKIRVRNDQTFLCPKIIWLDYEMK
jgi:hypothetical protein